MAVIERLRTMRSEGKTYRAIGAVTGHGRTSVASAPETHEGGCAYRRRHGKDVRHRAENRGSAGRHDRRPQGQGCGLGWARGGKLDPNYFSDESTADERLNRLDRSGCYRDVNECAWAFRCADPERQADNPCGQKASLYLSLFGEAQSTAGPGR
jgi:hypothetical protein